MEVLTVYISSKDKEKLKYNLPELLEVQKNAVAQISESRPANWSCLWALHEDLIEDYRYGERYEVYPAVLFLCKVS